MSRILCASLILAAIAIPVAASAQSQTPRPGRPVAAPPSAPQPVAPGLLRPLPASVADLTLRGEYASQERAVFVTAADALRVNAFQLGFLNAVSVLPEGSRLIVSVNDQQVGEVQLTASAQPVTAVLRLPPGLVVPGFNSVRLTAIQRHRVDCSAEATYELWTALDPRNTGFSGAGFAQIRRLAELPALAGSDNGITRLRLRVNEGADARTLARSMRVAQALVLLGWIQQPVLEFSAEPGVGPGIDLVVGTSAALADLVNLDAAMIEPELGLRHVRENGSERSVLAFVGSTGAELEAMIARLEAQVAARSAVGATQGLRALANAFGRRVESGAAFRFADLGLEGMVAEGPLHRSGFRVMLPGDFFPAPYGKARLRLTGSYAAEPDIDSRLEVRINDQVVVGIPLERGTDLFAGRDIELPLENFRPGLNTVAFEVHMRPRGQAACDPTMRQPRARLVMGGSSQIEFGQLARVGQYPRLAATLSFGLPYAGSGRTLDVYVSQSDPAYLDAGGTILARMVASAQTPIPATFHFGRSPNRSGHGGLVVGPLSEAPAFVGASAISVLMAAPLPEPTRPFTQPILIASAAATPFALGLAERPQVETSDPAPPRTSAQPSNAPGLAGRFGEFTSLQEMVLGQLDGVAGRLRGFGLLPQPRRSPGQSEEVGPNSVIMTQWASLQPGVAPWQPLVSAAHQPEVWTAVSATTPAAIAEAVDQLTGASLWHAIDGTRAIYRGEQRQVQSYEPASYVYTAPADNSIGNWRLFGAGWLSLNIEVYLAAMALACLLLGLCTALVLRVVRR